MVEVEVIGVRAQALRFKLDEPRLSSAASLRSSKFLAERKTCHCERREMDRPAEYGCLQLSGIQKMTLGVKEIDIDVKGG